TAAVTVGVPLTPAAGESRDSGPTFSTAGLTASGTVITFRGFLAAYEEGRDAERYQEDSGASAKDSKDVRLPAMISGQELAALAAEASGHETTPPPRYTEASLVKALEEREIGRPSTYAATMSTISDRGYVDHRGQALVPTWLAFAVTRLLEENFTELVDYDFTASMERDLDRIAAGEEDRVAWLRRFYNGQGASGAAVEETAPAAGELDAAAALRAQGLKGLVDNLGEIDARAVNSIEIGEGITLRVGRYGPYLEDGEGKRANVPADVAPDELTVDKARELFARAADDGRELGVDPVSGHVIIAKDGRYGPYVTEVLPDPEEVAGTAAADSAAADGQSATKPARTATSTKTRRTAKAAKPKPRTASLLRSMDLSTVTLEQALDLLSLPRVVGQDPESGADITAQNGRYGPYLKKGTDSRSLETEEQIFTVTLEQALEIFAQPKRRRGQAAARGPLRELGEDPATGKPVVIKDGRFGPYFTDGETNVTLRRGDDPATVTPERAFELLAEKRAKGPAKKRTTRKTTAKKTTAKKTTAKKAASKTATSGTAASTES
ncbi:topoisomerase C-terminal repeat-containing protein, partial [Actinomyces naeslundii]